MVHKIGFAERFVLWAVTAWIVLLLGSSVVSSFVIVSPTTTHRSISILRQIHHSSFNAGTLLRAKATGNDKNELGTTMEEDSEESRLDYGSNETMSFRLQKDLVVQAQELEELEFTETQQQNDLYQTFLDQTALRQAVQQCYFFSNTSDFVVETIVQSCTIETNIPPGSEIFAKGDTAEDLYFCRSGKFEVVVRGENNEQESTIVPLEQGEVFGELGLLFDHGRRAATVRASIENEPHSLWKLEKKVLTQLMAQNIPIFEKIVPEDKDRFIKSMAKMSVSSTQAEEHYKHYLEMTKLDEMAQKIPIFKRIVPEDRERFIKSMTKLSVPQGTNIITQGEEGDNMFIIESGTFECFHQETGEVMKVLYEGDYFGELALLFDQPRALSVRASSSNCKVWVLSEQNFDDAVETSNLSGILLDFYKEKYQKKSVWRSLLNHPKELLALARQKSRPKKKKVSFHSTMTSLAAGAMIPIL